MPTSSIIWIRIFNCNQIHSINYKSILNNMGKNYSDIKDLLLKLLVTSLKIYMDNN